jgi:DNA-3-methyladenine glycosylase I
MPASLRCPWAGTDPLSVAYHDEEWGVPSRDDRHLFEMLVLEGAQAGLSWMTILRKREGYREAFARFDPARVARFGPRDVERLLGDAGIVRNRLKIESAIDSARAFLALQEEAGSFSAWLWAHVDGRPVESSFREMREVPAKTPLAERISKDLRKRGFRFVGPTIVYAYLQAVGVVNDHLVSCPRRRAVARLSGSRRAPRR